MRVDASTASANAASKTRSNDARSSCRLTSVIRADQYRSRTRTGGTTSRASVNAAGGGHPDVDTPRAEPVHQGGHEGRPVHAGQQRRHRSAERVVVERGDHEVAVVGGLRHARRGWGPRPRAPARSRRAPTSAATQLIASATPGGLSTSSARTWPTNCDDRLDQGHARLRARCGAGSRPRAPARGTPASGRGTGGAARRAARGCGCEVSTTIGGCLAVNVPSSGTVTEPSPSDLEQQRLELVVGPVDLVDQQHRRRRPVVPHAAEDRSLDQVLLAEQVGLAQRLVLRLGDPDRQQLALVVPVVEGLARGQPLVALQPDQGCAEHLGQHLRGRGLARRRARPRAAAAAPAAATGTPRSRCRRRRGSRARRSGGVRLRADARSTLIRPTPAAPR